MNILSANLFRVGVTCAALLALSCVPAYAETARWSPTAANAWYAKQRWLVGSNFLPTDAINQFEMWQADTFNPAEIDKEFGYAEGIGMNTMRIFLQDQLWAQEPEGFKKRINIVLDLAAKHHIKPMLVLFDSCWDPNPKLGPQHPPIPGVHNSGWVQSPGTAGLMDEAGWGKYESYVKGIVGAFARDDRILAWDVWNEPDNQGGGNYQQLDEATKTAQVAKLLPQVFAWARTEDPIQPLTSGVWHHDDWSPNGRLNAVERVQIDQSDIISFHSYDWPERLEERIKSLQPYGRPLIMTEYMARGNGSTFDSALPMARKYNVGAINWGFVLGKSQTNLPWDSWEKPYTKSQPTLWFHDIFYPDGTPYRAAEPAQIKAMTTEAEKAFRKK
ncbi:cellulase family glycosylhydrolase [Asticcacaulis taihuensis]|uniref:Cellulase (Glycosyl hydrolase family 5) n=1 Tax=Asticcacaulis taihuensis TaxID=260084 RepID=A0A1G4SG86_9CAUL|nr:cellulase family glycosylhydrolase [Asticcacaulis taihuensis]SCW68224.1 Cellulase (glycosyl hydrolase family 5) [Asticcacaulis taihuensis]